MWISATSRAMPRILVVAQLVTPWLDDPVEQRLVAGAIAVSTMHGIGDDLGRLVKGGALSPLLRRGDRGHRVRMHESVGSIERVEGPYQTLESLAPG